jgi:hypothetical protein
MWTGPSIQDGRSYICAGLSAGLNLSLAKIQNYGVAASVDKELLFGQAQRAMRFTHEAVNHVVRIEVESGHRPVGSNAVGVRTLEGACARARNVELNQGTLPIAHKAVIYICLVNIPSRDRSTCIDSKRVGTLQGTWHVTRIGCIERGEGAMLIHQETVTQIIRVIVVSHDGSARSKASAKSTLAGSSARAGSIISGDDALVIPEKTVVGIACISVESCDLPTEADCEGKRTLAGTRARPRHIERGEASIPIPQETVTHKGRISGPSCDRPVRVHDFGAPRKGALGKWPSARARRIEDGNRALIGANVAVDRTC